MRTETQKQALTARTNTKGCNRILSLDIERRGGHSASGLNKYLTEFGMTEYEDVTADRLADFRDYLAARLAPATTKTYLAIIAALLNRYKLLPKDDIRDAVKIKIDRPIKAYLTRSELRALEGVEPQTANEKFVLLSFIVCAYTGMRISDIREVSPENISGNSLTYVSIKTHIRSTVPCNERVARYIAYLRANDSTMPLCTYERNISHLCERAGITTPVKIHYAGKDKVVPKFKAVSSHTARISFATNLAILGTPLLDISRMMGHTTTSMTERYIQHYDVSLSSAAMTYFE